MIDVDEATAARAETVARGLFRVTFQPPVSQERADKAWIRLVEEDRDAWLRRAGELLAAVDAVDWEAGVMRVPGDLGVALHDDEASQGITPAGIRHLLEALGWKMVLEGVPGQVWRQHTAQAFPRVLVPPDNDPFWVDDGGAVVSEIVNTIAAAEGPGALAIWVALRRATGEAA